MEKALDSISRSSWLSARLLTVQNHEQACCLHADALMVPQDATRASVFLNENIRLDGELPIAGPQTAIFLRAFDRGIPKVVKIPHEKVKATLEVRFCEENSNRIINEELALVPVRLLKLSGHYVSQRTPERKTLSYGLLMPFYAATLGDLPPPVDSEFASLVFSRIIRSISFMEEVGWVHGDVKPSNILISSDGNVWLGDYGSAVRATDLGDFLGGTPRYQCAEVTVADLGRFDRVGLVLTLLHLHGAISPVNNLSVDSLNALIQMIDAANIEESVKHLYRSAIGPTNS